MDTTMAYRRGLWRRWGTTVFPLTTTCTSGHCSDFAMTTMSTCCCRVNHAGFRWLRKTTNIWRGKTLRFPIDETLLLPITNVTVEALAHYLLNRLMEEADMGDLVELELFVSSGDGQMSSACWRAP